MNNTTFVHKYLKGLVNSDDICVDMTLGNGNDTLFLSDLCKQVIGFDISIEAINNSKKRLKDKTNVKIIHDSHINIDNYINEDISLFIFNLGYLPYSNKYSVTNKDTTLIAFKKAYSLLKRNGYIIITFYLGHLGGKDEYYLIDKYINENKIKVVEKFRQYKYDSPITYIIKKY